MCAQISRIYSVQCLQVYTTHLVAFRIAQPWIILRAEVADRDVLFVDVKVIVFNVSVLATGWDAVFWGEVFASEKLLERSVYQHFVANWRLAVFASGADGHNPDIVQLGDVVQEVLITLVSPVVAEEPGGVHVQAEGSTRRTVVTPVEVAPQHLVNLVRSGVREIARVEHGAWESVAVWIEKEVVFEIENRLVPDPRMRADWTRLDLAVVWHLVLLGVRPPTLGHVDVAVLLTRHRAVVLEPVLLHHVVLNVAPTLQKWRPHT